MRAFSTWTAVLALALGFGYPAAAQNQFAPAITVNERVITQYELTQRIRHSRCLAPVAISRRPRVTR